MDSSSEKKHHGKGGGRGQHNPPPKLEWAMSYEEMQARLDRERERTRQLSEELRTAKCPDGDREGLDSIEIVPA